jgi:hypothetical protein
MEDSEMTYSINARSAVRSVELHAAAATLRRIANMTQWVPPALAALLSKGSGATGLAVLKLAICAMLAALPVVLALNIASNAVRESARIAAHEHDSGIVAVNPLECRG